MKNIIAKTALSCALWAFALAPSLAEETEDPNKVIVQELIALQAGLGPAEYAKKIFEHYKAQSVALIEDFPKDYPRYSEVQEILEERTAMILQSQERWEKLEALFLRWAKLRGGTGKHSEALAADALKKNLEQLALQLHRQRVFDIWICCEMVLLPEELTFLKDYQFDPATETLKKYSHPQWDLEELLFSDASVNDYLLEKLKLAYKQRIEALEKSSQSNKEDIIQTIRESEKTFNAYLESSYDIVLRYPARVSKFQACEASTRLIIWHLRDLDRYFPL